MCKRLREITQSLALRPCLFRIKPKVVGVAEHTFKQQPGFLQLFRSSHTRASERLYVYGVPSGGGGPVLAVTDTQSYVLQKVGDVLPAPAPGGGGFPVNLTASSDGMLYAFQELISPLRD